VIKFAVCSQRQKAGGIMAVITFRGRRCMRCGLADRFYTVMAFAAVTKNLKVISKGDDRGSLGCVACLAHIAGRQVIWRLSRIYQFTIMTVDAF